MSRNNLRLIRLFVSQLLRINTAPFGLIHFVTSRCNLRCKHCFIYGDFESKTDDNRFATKELELSQINKLTKSIDRKMAMVSLTGGEPFLREDLLEIAASYVNNAGCVLVEVATNGTLAEEIQAFVKEFVKHINAKLYISISFDGLQQRHDQNRKMSGAFDKAVRVAEFLCSLKSPKVKVNATITVFDQPMDELTGLFKFLVENIKVDNISTSALRGEPYTSNATHFNLENYKKLNALIRAHILSHKHPLPEIRADLIEACRIVSRLKVEKTINTQKFNSPCTAGSAFVVVYSDGSVYPCEMLNKPMGSLKDYDMNLLSLMNSSESKDVRTFIKSQRCFCSFECAWIYNVLFQPQNWRELFSEFIRLKRHTPTTSPCLLE
jgi:radical SAM protein with 4Fe4S-binding SPASM domain